MSGSGTCVVMVGCLLACFKEEGEREEEEERERERERKREDSLKKKNI